VQIAIYKKLPNYCNLQIVIYKNGQIIAILQIVIYKNGQIIAILQIIKIPSIGIFLQFIKKANLLNNILILIISPNNQQTKESNF
jgi:hypothetical protein